MAHVIEQAAGRCNDHVYAAAKCMLLRAHSNTADDCCSSDRGVNSNCIELLDDLCRELAGGRDHESAGSSARPRDQLVEYR